MKNFKKLKESKSWNGKIYGDNVIYIDGDKFVLNKEELEQATNLSQTKTYMVEIKEIAKESVKAIMIEVVMCTRDGEKDKRQGIWLPKSLMQNNCIPEWFLNKKIAELNSMYQNYKVAYTGLTNPRNNK